jgi:hypothetical protein
MPGKNTARSNIVYTENATNKTKSKGDQLGATSGRDVEVSKHQKYVSRAAATQTGRALGRLAFEDFSPGNGLICVAKALSEHRVCIMSV